MKNRKGLGNAGGSVMQNGGEEGMRKVQAEEMEDIDD